ncbi:MAG: hypothetical protein ACJ73N_03965, partial [Bryobacteraceae bacterium]
MPTGEQAPFWCNRDLPHWPSECPLSGTAKSVSVAAWALSRRPVLAVSRPAALGRGNVEADVLP